ncbi:MAG: Uma2 family endonuclease [bacterium]|nr:Uma2 family endonuclease [bacterium]
MLNLEKTATTNDLQALVDLPENRDKMFELIAGVIYELTTPTPLHNALVMVLAGSLFSFVQPRKLGRVFLSRAGYELDEQHFLIPDVSYLSFERQPDLPAQFTIAPDLAVEVVSPSNTADEIQTKMLTYFAFGTRLLWVVYPATRTVVVHTSPQQIRTLTLQDTLDGGDVLPGFMLPLSGLFAEIA